MHTPAIPLNPLKRINRFVQLLLLLACVGVVNPSHGAPCSSGVEVTRNFDNGAGWELCVQVRNDTGLNISDVFFVTRGGTRRQVIKTLGLAALEVSALDSTNVVSHVNSSGIGVAQRSLSNADCPNGSLITTNSRNACVQVMARGYASKYYSTAIQGQALTVAGATALSTGDYVHRFLLADDGTIQTQLGHSGAITNRTSNNQLGWPVIDAANANDTATAFSVNALWRIDMQIGDSASNDSVETIEAVPSADRLTKTVVVTPMTREFSANINPQGKRAWRVVDRDTLNSNGQPVSYELAPVESGQKLSNTQRINWSGSDFYATRFSACETTSPALLPGCSGSLPNYINGQSIDRSDVVLWYRTTLFRLPAAEDQARQRISFMGFSLSPRDWMARDGN